MQVVLLNSVVDVGTNWFETLRLDVLVIQKVLGVVTTAMVTMVLLFLKNTSAYVQLQKLIKRLFNVKLIKLYA
jgi:hypothetical protein